MRGLALRPLSPPCGAGTGDGLSAAGGSSRHRPLIPNARQGHRMQKMARGIRIMAVVAASLLALGMLARIEPPGYTRIDLTGDAPGRNILSLVVPDGERIILTWRNSQFGLMVTEVFFARSGVLVQDQITFSAPAGPPPPRVSPRYVDDLYQTGGAFDARGLSRPFRRIVYRIGEIGDPRFSGGKKTGALKQAEAVGG